MGAEYLKTRRERRREKLFTFLFAVFLIVVGFIVGSNDYRDASNMSDDEKIYWENINKDPEAVKRFAGKAAEEARGILEELNKMEDRGNKLFYPEKQNNR